MILGQLKTGERWATCGDLLRVLVVKPLYWNWSPKLSIPGLSDQNFHSSFLTKYEIWAIPWFGEGFLKDQGRKACWRLKAIWKHEGGAKQWLKGDEGAATNRLMDRPLALDLLHHDNDDVVDDNGGWWGWWWRWWWWWNNGERPRLIGWWIAHLSLIFFMISARATIQLPFFIDNQLNAFRFVEPQISIAINKMPRNLKECPKNSLNCPKLLKMSTKTIKWPKNQLNTPNSDKMPQLDFLRQVSIEKPKIW